MHPQQLSGLVHEVFCRLESRVDERPATEMIRNGGGFAFVMPACDVPQTQSTFRVVDLATNILLTGHSCEVKCTSFSLYTWCMVLLFRRCVSSLLFFVVFVVRSRETCVLF